MNIEKQVCTLEQARKLSVLNIKYGALYSWVYDTVNERWDISTMPVEAHELINKERECYPAFTVAELGVMLPKDVCVLYNQVHNCWMAYQIIDGCLTEIEGLHYTNVYGFNTQAEGLAELLIYRLKKLTLHADEVNNRLKTS